MEGEIIMTMSMESLMTEEEWNALMEKIDRELAEEEEKED